MIVTTQLGHSVPRQWLAEGRKEGKLKKAVQIKVSWLVDEKEAGKGEKL